MVDKVQGDVVRIGNSTTGEVMVRGEPIDLYSIWQWDTVQAFTGANPNLDLTLQGSDGVAPNPTKSTNTITVHRTGTYEVCVQVSVNEPSPANGIVRVYADSTPVTVPNQYAVNEYIIYTREMGISYGVGGCNTIPIDAGVTFTIKVFMQIYGSATRELCGNGCYISLRLLAGIQ
jgi:hypothetical protein